MPVTARKLHAEGTCRILYNTEAPYFRDAQNWFSMKVSPQGTLDEFLGYVITTGTTFPDEAFTLFEGIGYVRCVTATEVAQWNTAAKYANTAKGFVVVLPTLTLFTEEQPKTNPSLL